LRDEPHGLEAHGAEAAGAADAALGGGGVGGGAIRTLDTRRALDIRAHAAGTV